MSIIRTLLAFKQCRISHAQQRSRFTAPPPRKQKDDPECFSESKVLPYTRKELYDVVADVQSYPKFVPYCTGSSILSPRVVGNAPNQTVMEAELSVSFLSFEESYVSQVLCTPHVSVKAVASTQTPIFKTLETTWRFEEAAPAQSPGALQRDGAIGAEDSNGSTLVKFDLRYEFASPLYARISATFFGKVASTMIQAFEDRCSVVYGKGRA